MQREVIIDAARSQRSSLRELIAFRELGFAFALRDIKVRYQDTVFGLAWAVLQPLANMVIFSLVLGKLGKLPSSGVPYPAFVFSGLIVWFLFANSVTQIGQSVAGAAQIIKKVYFPRLWIPLSAVAVVTLDFLVSTLLLVALMAYFGLAPSIYALFAPMLGLAIIVLAMGVGLLLASWSVAFRDFRFVIPLLIQLWMFATPVVYSIELIPEEWRLLAYANPMTGFVDAFRGCWLGTPINKLGVALSATITVAVLMLGLASFRRVECKLADEL